MILTNALLSIALGVVTNFAHDVPVRQQDVPTTVTDLRDFTVGDPYCPTDVFLRHRSGAMYLIRDGAVYMFEGAESYRHPQSRAALARLSGAPNLTSNQVVELAAKTMERLARGTNPVAGVYPVVRPAGFFRGNRIPFYEISWKAPDRSSALGILAGVEIDARNGTVTGLHLVHSAFRDYSVAERILRETYSPETPEPREQLRPHGRLFPLPPTNEVAASIPSWLWLCRTLGMDPGTETNLDQINWERTCLFTNSPVLLSTDAVCRVEFKTGTWFLSWQGIAIEHTPPDSYFTGDWQRRTPEERVPFSGQVNYRWQDMASDLERALIEKLGVPKECLASVAPHPAFTPAEPRTQARNKRVLILWTDPRDWNRQAFGAEFDAETGKLKDIGFTDPCIIKAVARTQGKSW